MKIDKIVITVKLDENDKAAHATEFKFQDGMWSSNGAVYSRLHEGLHYIWQTVRRIILENKTPREAQELMGFDDTYNQKPDDDDEENDPHFEGTLSRR